MYTFDFILLMIIINKLLQLDTEPLRARLSS